MTAASAYSGVPMFPAPLIVLRPRYCEALSCAPAISTYQRSALL